MSIDRNERHLAVYPEARDVCNEQAAATAVEAWGKRPRKAAGEATVAMPAAPLLQ